MAKGLRKPGEFCWINMLTPRPAEARAFFGKVLGWTYFEMPGIGHGVEVGGQVIGGLFDLEAPNVPPECKAMIGVMVKVDDADATSEKVRSLGGRTKPAFDISDQGCMAVCHDPNGGQFDLWEPRKMPGTEVDTKLPGAPSWFETMTTDPDRASRFYSALFGWTPVANAMPGFTYTTFRLDGQDIAGLMPIPPGHPDLKPHWGTYFTVNDADEAAQEATALGARLLVPPRDIPNVGRFCGIMSPQGVPFHVIRYSR
jgi:predicted enzyme related to lactoylglutathione lyase